MNGTFINKYFEGCQDYPKDKVENILPYGEVWNYISSSFLNGFINYVTPVKVFQIDRYSPEYEDMSQYKINVWKPSEHSPAIFNGTKSQLRDAIVKTELSTYGRIDCFADDIVVLGSIALNVPSEFAKLRKIAPNIDHHCEHWSLYSDHANKFMYFWFDCDVSDCSIGRFETEDSPEEVSKSLENWLAELKKDRESDVVCEWSSGVVDYHELPTSFVSHWARF